MSGPEMKQASPEHLARIEGFASPIVDHLQLLPPHIGMEVLLYIIVRCMLDLTPRTTHLDAFDQYMAAARITLEKNLEHAKATKQ